MTESDTLHRFIFENEPVRGEFVHLDASLQTILDQHQYPPLIRRLLSEALCAAVLLSAVIKFKGRLTLQFRGRGKIKLLLAQCNHQMAIRGLVKFDTDLSETELDAALQDGILAILLDGGTQETQYQGIVPWQGNSLAESIEGYFKHSEQLPTRLWLSAKDGAAAGFMLQVVPIHEKNATGIVNEIIAPSFSRILKLSAPLDTDDWLSLPYTDLLEKLYTGETLRVFPAAGVHFACTCSRKRSEDAINLLGKEEAEAEIKDKNAIVVTCDFCSKEYHFDRIEVAQIFDGKNQPPPDHHTH
ncbi:MAG TPA: Hsp33 family molecular chaperone HslO [Gammaproteobacteria bacterium]|jgi:molecular chaperone Hsp33|nr:Hsp33 family molecular chaperone HslO [Gammaproteobacteria bacterium]